MRAVSSAAASMSGFLQMGSGLAGGALAVLFGNPVSAMATLVPALGLMAAVSVQLGISAVRDPVTAGLFVLSAAALVWGRVSSLALVAIALAVCMFSLTGIPPAEHRGWKDSAMIVSGTSRPAQGTSPSGGWTPSGSRSAVRVMATAILLANANDQVIDGETVEVTIHAPDSKPEAP